MSVAKPSGKTARAGARAGLSRPGHPWWRGAVIYQIYPRSFRDANGDGVGDLAGVIQGLDYVASLNADGVWLSPFFRSPMRDFGYDVSDYCSVDPAFGALGDFDRLIAKAHDLGLKIIIDQIYSHTSDRHPWFEESRKDKTNAKADWYVWADPKPDGTPPNNWQSVFGGGAWTWDSRRKQYYFHNFLASQPALNLHHEAVQDALINVARFWLDRGVDGFRLDAINYSMCDPLLRDNPPAPRDGRKLTRPFDYQEQIHNVSHSDIPKFLEKIRQLTDLYSGIFTVAEIVGRNPTSEMKSFTAGENRLNSAYSLDFLYADRLTPELAKDALGAWTDAPREGWPSWAFSNHDAPRVASRWRRGVDARRGAMLFALILASLRGNVFLYQGEELGLPQSTLRFEDLKDPEAFANWPLTLGRDGARTPLPWTAEAPHAGFTSGKPWLPVDPQHVGLAIESQEKDPNSVLNFTRKLLAIRAASAALRTGDIIFHDAPAGGLVFTRRCEDEEFLCAFNLGDAPLDWRPDQGERYRIAACVGVEARDGALPASLAPLSGYLAERVSTTNI
jgi:alpha-glucosidase